MIWAVVIHEASMQDRDGAKLVFGKIKQMMKLGLLPRLLLVWADAGYRGKLVEWLKRRLKLTLEIVKRTELHTFKIIPKRWIVERTLGWFNRYRRLSKDYEFDPATSENMIYIAMIHLMLKRLA